MSFLKRLKTEYNKHYWYMGLWGIIKLAWTKRK